MHKFHEEKKPTWNKLNEQKYARNQFHEQKKHATSSMGKISLTMRKINVWVSQRDKSTYRNQQHPVQNQHATSSTRKKLVHNNFHEQKASRGEKNKIQVSRRLGEPKSACNKFHQQKTTQQVPWPKSVSEEKNRFANFTKRKINVQQVLGPNISTQQVPLTKIAHNKFHEQTYFREKKINAQILWKEETKYNNFQQQKSGHNKLHQQKSGHSKSHEQN